MQWSATKLCIHIRADIAHRSTVSCCFLVLRILYKSLTSPDVKSTRSVTGVQMVGVIVANGLLPYRDDESVSKDRYQVVVSLHINVSR